MKNEDISYSRKGRKIRKVGSGEMSVEESADADRIESAEAKEHGVRCTFRWGEEQLTLVKSVADKIGIPYQTYIKEAIYRQCMQDLQRFGMAEANQEVSYAKSMESRPSNRVKEQTVETFETSSLKKVLLAVPSQMLEQVDYLARCDHRTRSDLLREAIGRYLSARSQDHEDLRSHRRRHD